MLGELPDSTPLLAPSYEAIRNAVLVALMSPEPAGWGLTDLKSANDFLKREMVRTCAALYKNKIEPGNVSVDFLHLVCWADVVFVYRKERLVSKALQNLGDMAVSMYKNRKSNLGYKGYAFEYHYYFELTRKREQEDKDRAANLKQVPATAFSPVIKGEP